METAELSDKIKEFQEDIYAGYITLSNVFIVVEELMRFVSSESTLSGIEKKKMVSLMIRKMLDISPLTKKEKDALTYVLDTGLDYFIDHMYLLNPSAYRVARWKKLFKHLC